LTDAFTAEARDPILAAARWATNAELIADCAALGYLRSDWLTCDPTWGEGKWWTKWQPAEGRLIRHDKFKLDGVDFRQLPEPDMYFHAVTFDPPYVAQGGRKTSTIDERNSRYGIAGDVDDGGNPRTPAANQDLMHGGMKEILRVLKPKGMLLMKCQDYVSGGNYWPGTHYAIEHALDLGFDYIDRAEHISDPGPQPDGEWTCQQCPDLTLESSKKVKAHIADTGHDFIGDWRPQVHFRSNYSTLLVFRAPNRKQHASLFD
jgi:hypothetical protein